MVSIAGIVMAILGMFIVVLYYTILCYIVVCCAILYSKTLRVVLGWHLQDVGHNVNDT